MDRAIELYFAGFATRLVTTVAMICLGAGHFCRQP